MKRISFLFILLILVTPTFAVPFYPGIPSDYKLPNDNLVAYGISVARRLFYIFPTGNGYIVNLNGKWKILYPITDSSSGIITGYSIVDATPLEIFLLQNEKMKEIFLFNFGTWALGLGLALYIVLRMNEIKQNSAKLKFASGMIIYTRNKFNGIKSWIFETKETLVDIPLSSISLSGEDLPENKESIVDYFIFRPLASAYKIVYFFITRPVKFVKNTWKWLDRRYNESGRKGKIGEGDAIKELDFASVAIMLYQLGGIDKIKYMLKSIWNSGKNKILSIILRKKIREEFAKESAIAVTKEIPSSNLKVALIDKLFVTLNLLKVYNSGFFDSFRDSNSALNNSTSVSNSSTVLAKDLTRSRKFSNSADFTNINNNSK